MIAKSIGEPAAAKTPRTAGSSGVEQGKENEAEMTSVDDKREALRSRHFLSRSPVNCSSVLGC